MNQILSSKVDVGRRIRQAYQVNDKESLQAIARQELPKLRSQIEHFHALFSHQWLKENKVFGLDTVDIRMGGLLQRIKRAESRIEAYLAGQLDSIDELEVEILPFTDFYADKDSQPQQPTSGIPLRQLQPSTRHKKQEHRALGRVFLVKHPFLKKYST